MKTVLREKMKAGTCRTVKDQQVDFPPLRCHGDPSIEHYVTITVHWRMISIWWEHHRNLDMLIDNILTSLSNLQEPAIVQYQVVGRSTVSSFIWHAYTLTLCYDITHTPLPFEIQVRRWSRETKTLSLWKHVSPWDSLRSKYSISTLKHPGRLSGVKIVSL